MPWRGRYGTSPTTWLQLVPYASGPGKAGTGPRPPCGPDPSSHDPVPDGARGERARTSLGSGVHEGGWCQAHNLVPYSAAQGAQHLTLSQQGAAACLLLPRPCPHIIRQLAAASKAPAARQGVQPFCQGRRPHRRCLASHRQRHLPQCEAHVTISMCTGLPYPCSTNLPFAICHTMSQWYWPC